ncbi:MAG: 4Fe-4S dicluster domain-containing protein [Thermodesulfobacteriota bacterium]
MNTRVVKRETADYLELTLKMFTDRVSLRLDKRVCLKCDICSLVCPRDAVRILPGEEDLDISIDPRSCVFCEICSHFCPVAAISLSFNGQPKAIFADHQGLAPFFPKVRLDQEKCPEPCPTNLGEEVHWCRQQLKLIANVLQECPKHCHKCLEACPRQVIVLAPDGSRTIPELDLCLRCSQCLTTCAYEAIQVNPQFQGQLHIDDAKCPPDCFKCINLCPVKAIVREGERVFLRVETCAYCGVCLNICDQDAITLVRKEVVAEPGEFSQAWETAVAKLKGRKG